MTTSHRWTRQSLTPLVLRAADALRRAGAEAGAVVSLECARGLDSVVAFLAAVEAGCVPLLGTESDPPRRRADLRAATGARFVLRSTVDGEIVAETVDPAPGSSVGDRIAYVTATSGTSGQPKVAAVSRPVLADYMASIREAYGLSSQDRVLQFSPPGFDVLVEEVVPTFEVGASLVVPPWADAPSAAVFLDFIEEHAVTVVNVPSSYWMAVADHLHASGRAAPSALRLVVIGSEPASRSSVASSRARMGGTRLVNAYGISEVAPTCFVFDCGELDSARAIPDALPIGRPLPFVSHRIDSPPGQSRGRLLLGARAEAGLVDTGDEASAEPDGHVYLHGRADLTKVKRAGVTVNAEALAAVARDCDGVVAAAATVESDSGALVLTVRGALRPDPDVAVRVEAALRERFPVGWWPDRIVVEQAARSAGAKNVFPQPRPADTDLVALVTSLWAEALPTDDLDLGTDFFDGGGSSMAAVRLCAQLSDGLGHKVPAQTVFTHPVLGDFIDAVRALAPSTPDPGAPPTEETRPSPR